MESRATIATTVADKVRREHDHGDLARDRRQPRNLGMLSVDAMSATRGSFERPSLEPLAGFQPLDAMWAGDGSLSPFLRSSVSECLLTSNLAEVKLRL